MRQELLLVSGAQEVGPILEAGGSGNAEEHGEEPEQAADRRAMRVKRFAGKVLLAVAGVDVTRSGISLM
jgi:hypothetical protein